MRDFRTRGPARSAAAVAMLAIVAVFAGCGGGGGGGGGGGAALPLAVAPVVPATPNDGSIVAASTVAGQCAAPRFGVDPDTGAAFPDRPGSLATEKSWVRAWIDETYLWFDEVPSVLAADFATPIDYFDALKTPKLTAGGNAKDRFHFTMDTADYRALFQSGIEVGYGFELAFLNAAPPRDIRVAYTEPGTPASQAAIDRGAKVIAIDGIDVAAGADVVGLNAGLSPAREGESHSFRLQATDGSERTVALTSTRITRTPVQNVKTIATATGPVGYLLFNDHVATAESQLIAAVNQLKGAGVVDLVIDMRYNGGGLLDVASELAYMVSSPAATTGTVFERLQFNSKNPFGLNAAQTIIPFRSTSRGFSTPAGQPLPQLGLSRVTVLAGPDTCSASESVVNSLRGVGVAVNLIGDTTCGKPYGFYPEDNCGTTYFAIQFQGVNQQGFGDYGDGLSPTCVVSDDFGHALGDPAEARLAAALGFRATGACPVPGPSKADAGRSKAGTGDMPYLIRPPARENRIITRP
ncbi:S41 family peptidase [Variovorax sp. J22R24]|uniref:S41 family peptidase n=1 Tax=Variovorax gracilis TaxID=3053502 RepID=UPI002578404D|nr:S41 family peptidase [Variovorax sp. J22R24]MDM0107218.1 S41 family peptidase [Variovorax sp. J22R24]